jgi:hypothetical protein
MVALDHAGDKFLCHPVMCQGVDVERKTHVLLGGIEDVLPSRDTSIINEDCGLADVFADFGSGRCD